MDIDDKYNELFEWIDNSILGLNDCEQKDRLISIILEVLQRIPSEDRNLLMFKRGVRFVAPLSTCTAEMFAVIPRHALNKDEFPQPIDVWLVCLSSDISEDNKDVAIYRIAHELAHVFLEHTNSLDTSRYDSFDEREKDTDRQVEKWGFESELRKSPFNYLYGDGSV